MADEKPVLPQLPGTVWWGLRDQFKKTIPGRVTEGYLVAQLNVQQTAAKAYLAELKRLGIVDSDGRPTEIASQWRMDETYEVAAGLVLKQAYPRELVEVAPPTDPDRSKAVRWVMQTYGLGEGAAKNKVSTYYLVGSGVPSRDATPKASAPKTKTQPAAKKRIESAVPETPRAETGSATAASIPLNVNLQIHISSDASSEQIEAIFANMRKYLKD